MRKYQQLCLVLISLVSVIILLMYRSENSRLKYVLEVVNFFGRTDNNAIIRLENTTKTFIANYDQVNPPPVWTRIGSDFHVYSSFWNNNTLVAGGLETVSLVVGIGIVRFTCEIEFENGKSKRGKFVFTREDVPEVPSAASDSENYVIYTFICKINRDFGNPRKIIFIDTNSLVKHSVNVRSYKKNPEKQVLTLCLNLVPDNLKLNAFQLTNSRFLQFFLHHSFIGVENFLIYDSADLVSSRVKQVLIKNGANLNFLPYNFPFSSNNPKKIQKILEMDCLLRTKSFSKYTMISSPNEFLYTDSNLKSAHSPLKLLKKYPTDKNRFKLIRRSICVDEAIPQLANNTHSRVDPLDEKFSLFRPDSKISNSDEIPIENGKISLHRYVTCDDTNPATLDWRTTASSEFLEYYDAIAREVNIICSQGI